MTAAIIFGGPFACLFIVALMLLHPEYILFLYGVSLGFPDFAISLAGIINLRLDDLMILFLLIRLVITLEQVNTTPDQKNIVLIYGTFFAYALFSASVMTFFGYPPDSYPLIRDVGGVSLFLVLTYSVRSERSFSFLVSGMVVGGIALVVQVVMNFQNIAIQSLTRSSQLKDLTAFGTWNPNTVGQAGLLMTFVAGFLACVPAKGSRMVSVLCAALAAVFACLPAAIFARGATIGVLVGWLLFLLLIRSWKLLVVIVAFGAAAFSSWYRVFGKLIQSAADVDIKTGQGFSKRYDLWRIAGDLISQKPLLGHGFGQEARLYQEINGQAMSHDAYLSVWIELGLVGLCLLLLLLFCYIRPAVRSLLAVRNNSGYALVLGLSAGLCVESIVGMGLYGEKFVTIGLALMCVALGVMERRDAAPRFSAGGEALLKDEGGT